MSQRLFDLTGKVAIVTGAASGIGRAIALKLAEFGADVVVVDVDILGAKEVASKIESLGRQALPVKANVADSGDVKKMVKMALKKFGKIDILVNNAGIVQCVKVVNLKEEDWDKVMNVNLKGTYLCSKEVIKHMIKRRSGKIINISSITGMTGGVVVGANYAASKAGVACFTKTLARELAPYGINVNAIAPHAIDTPGFRRDIPDEVKKSLLEAIPLRRLGKPEEVANVALFLASDAASYITGQTIHVNGGALMV